ncbi:MAG TPA: hypothetical protein VGH74_08750, partial [Planctomycetaceae bacterium]
AEAAEDGWVVWTIVMQREMTGRIPIRVRYDLKPEQKDKVTQVDVQPVRVLSIPGKTAVAAALEPAAVSGEITVQKDRSLSVAARKEEGADDGAGSLEPIDVRELTLLPQEGNLAYRYFKQPAKLSDPLKLELTAERHDVQEVVETVIAKALIEAVVTQDKTVTFRCRYQLKTSERQRLELELPKDVEILDTFVAGKRVDLEKDAAKAAMKERDAFKINVARATPSDEQFIMAIVFRAPFKDNLLKGIGGNVALVFPRLGGVAQQGHAAVAMQQLRVAVWVPKEFTLVGTPKDFTAEQPTRLYLLSGAVASTSSTPQLDSWFGDTSSGLFAFTPAGRAYVYSRLGSADGIEVKYWRTATYTWVFSGALLVIGFVLAFTSWENRLTIVLLVAFVAAMYALQDEDQVLNAVAAARWGFVAMLLYWFIHALNRPKRPVAAPAPVGAPAEPAAPAVISPPDQPVEPENKPGESS